MTQIYNRRAFLQQCEADYQESIKESHPRSVLIMNVDYFKKVNDHYGHHIGDRFLEHVVELCQQHLTQGELFARYGGEEFVISIKNCTHQNAEEIANRIRSYVGKTPLLTVEGEVSVTLILGIAEATRQVGETVSKLLNKADKALYQAKASGRNRVCIYREESELN